MAKINRQAANFSHLLRVADEGMVLGAYGSIFA